MPHDYYSSSLGDETKQVQLTYEFKRGPARLWALRNPVLRGGEPGVEADTGFFKLGDGVTPWMQLPYYLTEDSIFTQVQQMILDAGVGSGGGGVSHDEFEEHVAAVDPHTNYDDGTSFVLRYQNAKV